MTTSDEEVTSEDEKTPPSRARRAASLAAGQKRQSKPIKPTPREIRRKKARDELREAVRCTDSDLETPLENVVDVSMIDASARPSDSNTRNETGEPNISDSINPRPSATNTQNEPGEQNISVPSATNTQNEPGEQHISASTKTNTPGEVKIRENTNIVDVF